ncbi:MAG: S-layer homology domain-containing protein [Bacillota bacterium]
MNKLRQAMITLTLVVSLLIGSAAADAKPGNGNGNGSPSRGSKAPGSQVENAGQSMKAKISQENRVEGKAGKKADQAVKFQAKKEAKAFKDTKSHWAQVPIQRLQLMGVVSGFPDDGFHPEAPVTEEQVIAMVMGALDAQEEQTADEVTDINELTQTDTDEQTEEEATNEDTEDQDELSDVPDWAKGVVAKAKDKGIVNLNRFHSGVQASRVQSMVWVAKAMGLEPADTSTLPFKDGLLVSQEDIGYVMALYNEGIVKGGPGGLLNPNSSITRAQIAALIDRVLAEQQQTEDANALQAVETVDGNQVLKIGTGESATEVALAEDVVIFINGQQAEISDLVAGSSVSVVTNEEGQAVLVEQTVETTQQENESTTDTNTTTEENTNSTTTDETSADTSAEDTTAETGSASS